MDRLKAILADRILDLTSTGGDDMKIKVDKMQRFRDFANACQTLMIKYPQIEDELIKMINDGDFDTKVASSRVDSVIRLADQNTISSNNKVTEVTGSSVEQTPSDIEAPQYLPEDIDYEEVQIPSSEDDSEGYVQYTDVNDTDIDDIAEPVSETIEEAIVPSEPEDLSLSEEELATIKRKAIIKRVVQVIGIILAVIVLIIIIKFVLKHWVIILSIIGGLAVIAIIIWFMKNKKS